MIRLGRLNKFIRLGGKIQARQEVVEDKKEEVVEATIPEVKKPVEIFVELKVEEVKSEQLKAQELKAEQVKLKLEQMRAEQLKTRQLKAEQSKAEELKAQEETMKSE